MIRKIFNYFTSEEFVNAQTEAAMRRVRYYYKPVEKKGDKRRK